jgi:hypothetical protein
MQQTDDEWVLEMQRQSKTQTPNRTPPAEIEISFVLVYSHILDLEPARCLCIFLPRLIHPLYHFPDYRVLVKLWLPIWHLDE